jgi:nucleoside phosphorylase
VADLADLADPASMLSWTPERWKQGSTGLKAILIALDSHLSKLPGKWAKNGDTHQVILLHAAKKETEESVQSVRASLNYLQDDRLTLEERRRALKGYARSSKKLQQAVRELKEFLVEECAAPSQPGEPKESAHRNLEYAIEQQPWYSALPPETEEIEAERVGVLRSRIDAVLITATEIELLAVLSKLQPPPRRRKVSLVYWGPETYYLGKFGACLAVVTKCRMGALNEGSVILATDQAQRLWSPRVVIMIGIAFGKDQRKQRIADVIVASQVVSYEQQRVGAEIIFRGPISPSNGTLLNRFENAADWRFERPDKTSCGLIVGPILSGEKLVDEPAFKRSLFDRFPQAVGGEMEGAGLCAATGRIGTAWILVKAICDWADGKKDSSQQPLAAAAATSLVLHILSRRTALRAIERPKLSAG